MASPQIGFTHKVGSYLTILHKILIPGLFEGNKAVRLSQVLKRDVAVFNDNLSRMLYKVAGVFIKETNNRSSWQSSRNHLANFFVNHSTVWIWSFRNIANFNDGFSNQFTNWFGFKHFHGIYNRL